MARRFVTMPVLSVDASGDDVAVGIPTA